MAALAVTNPTLLDMAKAMDPNGKIADLVEILNETNEVLDDMTWVEGNLPTGHRTTIAAGLPTPTWRSYYQGVQPTKGRRVQVTDTCGMLEAYAEIDKALADLNGNSGAFRLQEDRFHIEGMSQEAANTIFYGNDGAVPNTFLGLQPRYNSTTADNGENVILGGSVDTDNASIYLVVWGSNTIHGIVPKGSTAGLQMQDKGQVTIEDANGSNGGRYEAYRTHYRWDMGLSVRDWRYAVRIANIDKSALTKDAASGADLPDLMFRATELIPNLGGGRPCFYMSRNTRTFLRRQMSNLRDSSTLAIDEVGGKRIMFFQDIPVKRCDALAADEALVS